MFTGKILALIKNYHRGYDYYRNNRFWNRNTQQPAEGINKIHLNYLIFLISYSNYNVCEQISYFYNGRNKTLLFVTYISIPMGKIF